MIPKEKAQKEILSLANELMGCGKDNPFAQMTDAQIKNERYKDFMKKNGWPIPDDLNSYDLTQE